MDFYRALAATMDPLACRVDRTRPKAPRKNTRWARLNETPMAASSHSNWSVPGQACDVGPDPLRQDTASLCKAQMSCPLPAKVKASVFFATDLRQKLPLATRGPLLLVAPRSTIDNDKCRVEVPQVG
jgi:hypothetical protein